MIRRQDFDRLRITGLWPIGCAAAAAFVLLSSAAIAQTSSYQPATDNVYINWGALNGGQASPPAVASPPPAASTAPEQLAQRVASGAPAARRAH